MKRINGAESQIRPEAVRQHPSSFIADKMKLFQSKERWGSYFLDFKTVQKNNKFLEMFISMFVKLDIEVNCAIIVLEFAEINSHETSIKITQFHIKQLIFLLNVSNINERWSSNKSVSSLKYIFFKWPTEFLQQLKSLLQFQIFLDFCWPYWLLPPFTFIYSI